MEIPEELRKEITFHPVKHMDEVIALALGAVPKAPRTKRTSAKKTEESAGLKEKS